MKKHPYAERVGNFFATVFLFYIGVQTVLYLDTNYEKMSSEYFTCLLYSSIVNILLLAIGAAFLSIEHIKKFFWIVFAVCVIESFIKIQFEKNFLIEFQYYFEWDEHYTTVQKFFWHLGLDTLVLSIIVGLRLVFVALSVTSKR